MNTKCENVNCEYKAGCNGITCMEEVLREGCIKPNNECPMAMAAKASGGIDDIDYCTECMKNTENKEE